MGDLAFGRVGNRHIGPQREGDEPKPMKNEREKSDPAVVVKKSANEAGQPVEEWMEPRAGAEGNAGWQSMLRTQGRASMSQALGRIRKAAKSALHRQTPKVGAVCGKSARTVLCGGRIAICVPTAIPPTPICKHGADSDDGVRVT